jgi:predicted SprT family Zn-dependent metalloprotease
MSVLDQQLKILQLCSRQYDWKSHVKLFHSSVSPIPPTVTKRRGTQSTRKKSFKPPTLYQSDESDDFEDPDTIVGGDYNVPSPLQLFDQSVSEGPNSPICTEILSAAQKSRRTRRSLADMKSFSRNRTQMALEMYEKYNGSIFKSQLPRNIPIVWNKNLHTTAGRAFKDPARGIELSVKVIDTPLRLRDTLLHEMCHVAVFTLPTVFANRNAKPHGTEFWHWANTVNRTIPDAVNDRCHSYEIFKPYQFRCTNKECNQLFERHSKKGLDIEK